MLTDTLSRPLTDLRISVTDRCNFRCSYCMPLEEYTWAEKSEILSFEEIARLARLFVSLGVTNVSLDTLDRAKFKRITNRGNLSQVLASIFEANAQGLQPIKINAVVVRGENENDVVRLADFSRKYGFEMRFIEYMDVGNVNEWTKSKTVTKKEILSLINERFPLEKTTRTVDGPSVNYKYLDGQGTVGVIASITEPFCSNCTRARITAGGKLVTCLFSARGHDLKEFMRDGATDSELLGRIRSIWRRRTDQYSENRIEDRKLNILSKTLNAKKLEMISLGG